MAKNWLRLDVSELDDARKCLARFRKKGLDVAIEEIAIANGKKIVAEARRRTPKKSGNLKKHWRTDNEYKPIKRGGDWEITVQNNCVYARCIEYGRKYSNGNISKGYFMLTDANFKVLDHPTGQKMMKVAMQKFGGDYFD